MNKIYLKFYEKKTRKLHEDEIDNTDLSNNQYVYYESPYYLLRDNYYIGSIDLRPNFGFLRQFDIDDLYIDKDNLKDVMNNDILLVKKSRNNEVVSILKRALDEVIVTVKKFNSKFKYYTDKPLHKNILLKNNKLVVVGQVLRLKVLEIKADVIETELIEVLGHVNDPDIDIKKIIASHQWPDTDTDLINKELNAINVDYEEERKTRLDLTDEFVFTIDGADAKDLDDAISIKYQDGFYDLGVHIADVSHFVTEGSYIDQNAYEKATSVYLANAVIPMLPHKLSNDLCSLNPNEEKLTLSALMKIDKQGKVVEYEFRKSIVKSSHRLTYEEVNNYIYDKESLANDKLNKAVDLMVELSDILEVMRKKRGEISFESTELKFEIKDYKVVDVHAVETYKGENLIESFMLLANETIAFHMEHAELPSIYRIHETPNSDKLTEAIRRVQRLGVKTGGENTLNNPNELQKITESVSGKDISVIVNMLLLRAMQRAKYSKVPKGHFGLAARHYTHFTSPIRRYPDLILHRIIKDIMFAEAKDLNNKITYYEKHLDEIAEHSSIQERIAIDMERDVNKLMSVKYLNDKVGRRFDGVIIQMLASGMFVRLDNGIEGYIKMRDNYRSTYFDQDLLTYRANNTIYKLGQKIKVELISVDLLELEIDFKIYEKKKRKGKRRR